MIRALIFDFARVLLFTKDKGYKGPLNELNNRLSQKPNYDFLSTFELNTELLNFLGKIKVRVPVYMFTSETIQERPEISGDIAKVFSKIYSAKKMGMAKTNPETYKFIAKDLKLTPGEIVFVDDSSSNIDAAASAGLKGIQYKDNRQIIGELQKVLE